MTDKQLHHVYLAVKAAILAVALILLISGLQCMEAGEKGGTLLFLWLSGVLTWAFVTLEE